MLSAHINASCIFQSPSSSWRVPRWAMTMSLLWLVCASECEMQIALSDQVSSNYYFRCGSVIVENWFSTKRIPRDDRLNIRMIFGWFCHVEGSTDSGDCLIYYIFAIIKSAPWPYIMQYANITKVKLFVWKLYFIPKWKLISVGKVNLINIYVFKLSPSLAALFESYLPQL
jgi:hypothetical protein